MHLGDGAVARRADRLRLTLHLAHAFVLVGAAVAVAALSRTSPTEPGSALHVVAAVVLLLVAVSKVLHGERVVHVLVLLVLVAVLAPPQVAGTGDFSVGSVIAVSVISASRAGRRWWAPAGTLLVAALVCAGSILLGGGELQATSLSTVVVAGANALAASAFVATLERSTHALDVAEAATAEQRLRLAEADQVERVVDSARQVLHDDVLGALGAIEAGRPARRQAAEAASAVDAIDAVHRDETDSAGGAGPAGAATDGAAPLDTLVTALRDGSPVALDLELDLAPGPRRTALDVATVPAVARALLEALRNVERHAGVERAVVRIVSDASGWRFAVQDTGRGIAAGTAEGFGLTESVRASAAEVGARVEVSSSPGGTTVEVVLDHPVAARRGALAETYRLTMAAGGQRRLAWTTMLTLAASWWLVGGAAVLRSEQVLVGAGLLVAITALVLLTAHRVATRPPTLRWLLGFTVALTGLDLGGLATTPDGGLLDFRSWSTGFLAITLILVCFVVPVRWALGLAGLQAACVLAAVALRPGLSDGAWPVGSLNAWTAVPLLVLLLGAGLRRNARVVRAEQAAVEEAAAGLLRRRVAGDVTSLHLEHTRSVVAPWLRRVATGELDPADPQVRAEAGLLALEARDDLHVPGFYDPALRRAVTEHRRRGGSVTLRPGFGPGAASRASGRLLAGLLDRLPGAHQVQMSPPVRPGQPVRVVLRPPPGPLPWLAELGAREVQRDDFAVVVELPDSGGVEAPVHPVRRTTELAS